MTELIAIALGDHAKAREDYMKGDPNMVAARDPSYETTVAAMKANLRKITAELRGSIPLSSHRNQSHMYWDITMPGAAGYFAGMLFNQNNVAAEASPVTTGLEIQAARDLCTMLGYDMGAMPVPWGHITCDGSVANIESMWAARNLKYQAVALARAIRVEPSLEGARGINVRKSDGTWARLLDLTLWELLNLATDDALDLPKRLVTEAGIAEAAVKAALDAYSIRAKGTAEFDAEMLHGAVTKAPAILVPATAHYSWVKAATLLGLGTRSVRPIPVDLDGRMVVSELARELNACLEEERPVVQVVAVIGSTEESAVDPLTDILALRDQFAGRGLTFALHADAAWGGYFASTLRQPAKNKLTPDGEETGLDDTPEEALSDHVRDQFAVLHHADTITVDPHKSGYVPYPAGALCYRNRDMIFQIALTSPVVFHDGEAPTVGVYGIEGSKPGAAAVGVMLSHITVPPNKLGYGRLLGRCVFNSKRYYAALTTLAKPDDDFIVVPLQRLPAEKDEKTATEIEAQKTLIAEKIVGHSNRRLREIFEAEPEILNLFQALGPDLTVFAYAFNFKVGGKLNRDLTLFNEFNNALFHRLSLEVPEKSGDVPKTPLFVTSSAFDPAAYGEKFVKTFAERAGLDYNERHPVRFLISTMQNPFLTATADGNFIPTLMTVFRETIEDVRGHIIARHDLEKEA
ncbi:pyridoxal phosphate-dependent decarboxylase family protein [Defluviimonas sp. SAOS-178_SWC]|uniref:pyridoxal phosphate-dependent decarboxylase family protein n=1 Tax=Defluviimonas sp. SAOS-178_SWC TaxID=3121287 RepID=UPI003221AE2B